MIFPQVGGRQFYPYQTTQRLKCINYLQCKSAQELTMNRPGIKSVLYVHKVFHKPQILLYTIYLGMLDRLRK
jgi:hypothetical protein